ncbi:DgyrCDS3828 [Dimorphilus gyrociliatus]|uniref:DgyrCDS3828 n=1 Tax=Dimorphilus gyrociliatus TaxID=2664684 RepID=A0A7I8VF43_9ANNE|nr:DgyrCDS3828 [Dimorphilus gyrociliatus]
MILNPEYNQVCSKSWLNQFSSTVYIGGIFIGSSCCGFLSDRFGRKVVLGIGTLLHMGFGIGGAYAPNTALFLIFRFFQSIGSNFTFIAGFVLGQIEIYTALCLTVMELIGPIYRESAGILYQFFFSIGFMILPGIAYFIRQVERLQLTLSLSILPSFLLLLILPESPRWLFSKGRFEESKKLLEKVARINNKTLPDLDLKAIYENERADNPEKANEKSVTLSDMLKSRQVALELFICSIAWFTNSLVYYGLSLNTGTLSGSIFLNTFLSGIVEIPAHIICIFGLKYYGRVPTFSGAFLFAGVTSIANVFAIAFNAPQALQTTLSMMGKASITVSFDVAYVLSAELFPTPIRALSLGICSSVSRISGMASPYVGGSLQKVQKYLPALIFGVFGFASFALTVLLPETSGKPMPDTLEEAEAIGRVGCRFCRKKTGSVEPEKNNS